MSFIQAFLLGVIQGLTEFLPVSSSAHLVFAQHWMKGFEQPGLLFDVVLHLATLVAVVFYFRSDLIPLMTLGRCRLKEGVFEPWGSVGEILRWIVFATVPTAVIGVVFQKPIEILFSNARFAASSLWVTGLLLYSSEYLAKARGASVKFNNWRAFLIGVAQGIAILPGISRSGSTLAVALFMGLNGVQAARFSFLISIPAILGAFVLQIPHLEGIPRNEFGQYLLGGMTAGILGWLTIAWLFQWVRQRKLHFFAYYCWLMGSAVLVFSFFAS